MSSPTTIDAPTRRPIADWLLDAAMPRFGIMVTWLLCLFAIILACSPIEFADGVKSAQGASLFSWLPEGLLRSGPFFTGVRVVLAVSAVCWILRVGVPVSCWITTFAFMLMWSLRMENLTNGAHIFNVTNMLMFIHALWYQFYWREMKSGVDADTLWTTACYPRWVFLLSLFYLGWFHTLAGVTKILNSGFGWGNGVSLQLWTELFGNTGTPFAQTILFDSRLTAVMQTGALVIECASILCLLSTWLRYAVGIGLTGFYIGVLTTFVTFGFHFNAVLVALFLLPVDWLIGLQFNNESQGEIDGVK
jgi:hypothetical protein